MEFSEWDGETKISHRWPKEVPCKRRIPMMLTPLCAVHRRRVLGITGLKSIYYTMMMSDKLLTTNRAILCLMKPKKQVLTKS